VGGVVFRCWAERLQSLPSSLRPITTGRRKKESFEKERATLQNLQTGNVADKL